MKSHKNLYLSLCFTIPLFYLTACATMDRSECEVADWQLIGYEDGTLGKPSSIIGRHRSACAEYTITPDLESYLLGHKKGLKLYCNYQNGFSLGERGGKFNNVCVDINRSEFNNGYQKGRQHYTYRSEINGLKSDIKINHKKLNQFAEEIQKKEEMLVSDRVSSAQRRILLTEIKDLNFEIEQIEQLLVELESRLFRAEDEYARFSK